MKTLKIAITLMTIVAAQTVMAFDCPYKSAAGKHDKTAATTVIVTAMQNQQPGQTAK